MPNTIQASDWMQFSAIRSCAIDTEHWKDADLGRYARQIFGVTQPETAPAQPVNDAQKLAAPNRPTRARRGSKREGLLELIQQNDGLTRGDILERMGLKGNKSGEMSVSNALTSLKKKNQVRSMDGKYYPVSTETSPGLTATDNGAVTEDRPRLTNEFIASLVDSTGISEAELRAALEQQYHFNKREIGGGLARVQKSGKHVVNRDGMFYRVQQTQEAQTPVAA